MEKGVAFPTCVNVNNCVAHYSPLESDAATVVLVDGDIVKVWVVHVLPASHVIQ
jgi:methionine aminopeptidase